MTVRVWNETVSNLTLMALGSSAPEILLSLIEVFYFFLIKIQMLFIYMFDFKLFHLVTRWTNLIHTHVCKFKVVLTPCFTVTGVRTQLWCRGARPRHHRGKCRLQYVCDYWSVCVGDPWRRVSQDQTPAGVFYHSFLEHFCLHLALPHTGCHFTWDCRGGFHVSWI